MSRRILAGVAAAVLAILAAVLVVSYANSADQRAMEGMAPTRVLIVEETIPEGTPAEDLADYVSAQDVPETTVASGALASVQEIQGEVTTSQLYPGEQLLVDRFASPAELEGADQVEVPEGFHEISIQLSTNRVIGGRLKPGDTVGFFVNEDGEGKTHLVLHKVLVTAVQGGIETVEEEDGDETSEPADSVMVTLAVKAPDAEIISNAAEFHGIWLSLEPEDAPEDGTREVTAEDMFP